MEVKEKYKENKIFLDSIGLMDKIKTEKSVKEEKEENMLLNKIYQEILIKGGNNDFKDKILNKLDFIRANKHYYSLTGIPEDELGILAVIYYEDGKYYLQYNSSDNGKNINVTTEDQRNGNSLLEKITITHHTVMGKKQIYVDYHNIFSKNYEIEDNNIKDVAIQSCSLVFDEQNKIEFIRETSNTITYSMNNGREDKILEEKFEANSKWRNTNDFYLLGNKVSRYQDNDRIVSENYFYIARNICPSQIELEDSEEKTLISEMDFNDILDKKKTIAEVLKKESIKKLKLSDF